MTAQSSDGMNVRGMRVAIVGTGMTGQALANALIALEADPVIVDTRSESAIPADALAALTAIDCPVLYENPSSLADVELVVTSPGIGIGDPFFDGARDAGVEIIGEIELAARLYPSARVIGITGTNGKSTTTALAAAIIEAAGMPVALCGNIGSPLITHVLERDDDPFFVTELSSFQLETTSTLRTRAAVIMNVSDDHRDRHPEPTEYAATKARVFANQTTEDTAVLGIDCPAVTALGLNIPRERQMQFSSVREVDRGGYARDASLWYADGEGRRELICPLSEMRLQGTHNILNALAATCLTRSVGVEIETAGRVIRSFLAAPHTYRAVGSADGVLYINDSKGTNVDATAQALRSSAGPVVLIAGGSEKNADFAPLAGIIAEKCRSLLAIGETGPRIASVASAAGLESILHSSSLEDAVEKAVEIAKPGDTVLMSPACASFDMFRSYKHRGDVFEASVGEIPGFTPVAEE